MSHKLQIDKKRPSQDPRTELYRSEQRLQDIAEVASDWFWETDSDLRFTYISDRFYEVSSISPKEVLGKTRLEFISDHERKTHPIKWEDHEADLLNRRPFRNLEYQVHSPDGKPCYIQISGKPFFNHEGVFLGYRGAGSDITAQKVAEKALQDAKLDLEYQVNLRTSKLRQEIAERKQAEENLRKSEQKYRNIVENAVEGLFQSTPEGRFLSVNPAFARMFGYGSPKELVEKVSEIETQYYVNREDRRRYQQLLQESGHVENFEFRARCKDGSQIWVSTSARAYFDKNGTAIRYEGIVTDITERKKLAIQLQQAHKMEAIGALAGGIAHDFNNILSAILGYTELSLPDAEPGSKVYGNLIEVLNAGERARDLVRQILSFSRQGDQELLPLKLTPIINEVLKFIRASLPTSIEIRQKLKSDPTMLADPTQIHQVIMNLCTNAAQAMQDRGGILDIGLESIELDSEFTARHPGLQPGVHVKLTVSDAGHGISSELAKRIFDPFFTTKEKGEGTGMGLAVVHGIVKNHGGTINVYSDQGKGSVFTVFFPAIEQRSMQHTRFAKAITGGTESILFVDDEVILVELGVTLLGAFGYKVTGAKSSVEALGLFKNNPDQFDLVITDLAMPQITGDHLAEKLLKIKPGIPIILCTGFSASIDKDRAMAMGIRAFLNKPILRRQLSETIRKVLDNP